MQFGVIDRVMLLGGGQLLVDVAHHLIGKGLEVTVVTSRRHAMGQVSAIAGEGSEPMQAVLESMGIPVHPTPDVNSDATVAAQITGTTLGLSLSAEWIIRTSFIERFGGRLLNMHGSALPVNRGGGGYSWSILQGDREGACTLHVLDAGIDTGAIVLQQWFPFPGDAPKPAEIERVARKHQHDMLFEFFERVGRQDHFPLREQDHSLATYWPRLKTDVHGWIDWSGDAVDVERFIRAFDDPYAGASSTWRGQRVRLKDAALTDQTAPFHAFQRGIVFRKGDEGLHVVAGRGALLVRRVEDTDGTDLVPRIQLGDRFVSPVGDLAAALEERVVYKPEG